MARIIAQALGVSMTAASMAHKTFEAACTKSELFTALLSSGTAVVPELVTGSNHKGEHGRVGVVGGSLEYTGAPYFAAITALKTGADLSHVFSTAEAAVPIKTYSPDLIVHPLLPTTARVGAAAGTAQPTSEEAWQAIETLPEVADAASTILEWGGRMHAVIVGPGLGRDPIVLATASAVLRGLRARGIPVVIDADGLYLLSVRPSLLLAPEEERPAPERSGAANSLPPIILTPNVVELRRLHDALAATTEATEIRADGSAGAVGGEAAAAGAEAAVAGGEAGESEPTAARMAVAISRRFGGLAVLAKGRIDVIAAAGMREALGEDTVPVAVNGPPRRCGGQGDVLSGAVATFLAWAQRGALSKGVPLDGIDLASAAAAGAALTRMVALGAFSLHGRSTTTADLVDQVGPTVRTWLDASD